ncbi:hypothetical protein [Methylomonas sp. MgM2]
MSLISIDDWERDGVQKEDNRNVAKIHAWKGKLLQNGLYVFY